jgi:hypothetical protein
MANIDVTNNRKANQSVNNEVGRGWTHVGTVKFSDFVANPSAADSDTLTFPIAAIPQYSIVDSVGFRLVTPFNDDAGGTSLTLQLGDTGDADGFVTATQIHLDGTEVFIAANTGAYFTGSDSTSPTPETTANVIKGKTYTTANTLEALFTPSGYKLDECTAGEVKIFARIVDTSLLVA